MGSAKDGRVRPPRRVLGRLAADTRGNMLAVMAAAMVPLLALLGSGIDLTRAYMAKARLQQACDAAALAGRRAMTGGTVDATVSDEARKFFNFNFPQQSWGTTAFTPSITQGADATVVVTASTAVETQIMRLFGFDSLPLSVECDAKQDFVNTDIVLVLDTTGSMNHDVNNNDVSGGPSSKIVALRKAVLALYDELAPVQARLEAAGLRLRYGVVPYSSGVNVGEAIMAANPDYIASRRWTYQSREPLYQHVDGNTDAKGCAAVKGSWKAATKNSPSTCTYTDTSPAGGTATGEYDFGPKSWDISGYARGDNVLVPSRKAGTTTRSRWAGCIEERQTVSTITASSGYTIPSGAMDLNIDLVPTSDDATRWKPYWPEVVYRPDTKVQPQRACPTPSRRLRDWTRRDLSAYLDTLSADGGTYHDNGMIWGTRLLSQGGIFAGDNPRTFGNMPVSRQIIYMTDGMIDTGATIYGTYGMEFWDRRITGGWVSDADSDKRHDQRFRMMCASAKQMGVSVWVIAFASKLSDSLSACASNAAQASTLANSTALTAKFVEIGKSIGALRLTK